MSGTGQWIAWHTSDANSRRRRLFVCFALSLAFHVLILDLAPGRVSVPQVGATPSPLTLRLPQTITTATRPDATVRTKMPKASPPEARISRGEPGREKQATPENSVEAAIPGPTGTVLGPWYFPARYLHRRPSPLKPIWPEYPAGAEHLRGRVTILLLINEQGLVDQYRIRSAEPEGIFESSVIEAFSSAAYAPALITGYKVKSQLLVEVTFEPGAPPRANFSIMDTAAPGQNPTNSFGKGN